MEDRVREMVVITRKGNFITLLEADTVEEGIEKYLLRTSDDFDGGDERVKRFFEEGFFAEKVRVIMKSVVV